jgi:hypothetical protein
MRTLNDYVESAAAEYWQETGRADLDPLWIAEYYQDGGVMDDHPRLGVVAFFALVEKMLAQDLARAEKIQRIEQEKASHPPKRQSDV